MCEFCLNPNRKGESDANHVDFAGFFSPDAIDRAIRQANEARTRQDGLLAGNEDDDGT